LGLIFGFLYETDLREPLKHIIARLEVINQKGAKRKKERKNKQKIFFEDSNLLFPEEFDEEKDKRHGKSNVGALIR
jgi:hypothetical protein